MSGPGEGQASRRPGVLEFARAGRARHVADGRELARVHRQHLDALARARARGEGRERAARALEQRAVLRRQIRQLARIARRVKHLRPRPVDHLQPVLEEPEER
jgi:hypothetical protein